MRQWCFGGKRDIYSSLYPRLLLMEISGKPPETSQPLLCLLSCPDEGRGCSDYFWAVVQPSSVMGVLWKEILGYREGRWRHGPVDDFSSCSAFPWRCVDWEKKREKNTLHFFLSSFILFITSVSFPSSWPLPSPASISHLCSEKGRRLFCQDYASVSAWTARQEGPSRTDEGPSSECCSCSQRDWGWEGGEEWREGGGGENKA